MPDNPQTPPAQETPQKPSAQKVLLARAQASFEKAVAYVNARNAREKTMIIVLAAACVFALDYLVLVNPIVHLFGQTLPKLEAFGNELDSLRADQKNKDLIARDWEDTKARLAAKEGSFVAPNELPALLEDLSRLAGGSGVKILNLKPSPETEEKSKGRYALVPIQISGLAATHDFGNFLAQLEGGPRFFRVTNVTINTASVGADARRHSLALSLETYRMEEQALRSAKK